MHFCCHDKCDHLPGRLAHLAEHRVYNPKWTYNQGEEVRSPGPALTCAAFGHAIFSTSICSLPLIHVRQLSVTGTSKGTRYWLFETAVI